MANEEIPYWKQQQLAAEAKKAWSDKYPEAGKTVKRMGEHGVIVVSPDAEEGGETYCIRYDNKKENDMEGLSGLPYEYAPDYILKHINSDGTLK